MIHRNLRPDTGAARTARVDLAEGFSFVDASQVLGLFAGTRQQAVERFRGFREPTTD